MKLDEFTQSMADFRAYLDGYCMRTFELKGDNVDKMCVHVTKTTIDAQPTGTYWCCFVGCYDLMCNECFDGHLLESHLFLSKPHDLLRIGFSWPKIVEARARYVMELCGGSWTLERN